MAPLAPPRKPVALIVMGVAGSGKTTVGKLLARELGAEFIEGDDLMPPANVAKMSGGSPLDDTDRWPWLAALAAETLRVHQAGHAAVIACSALKRAYREFLRSEVGGEPAARRVLFVHLAGSFELIAGRLTARAGHFMPPSLLASQFATLEAPGDLTFDISPSPADIVAAICAELTRRGLAEA